MRTWFGLANAERHRTKSSKQLPNAVSGSKSQSACLRYSISTVLVLDVKQLLQQMEEEFLNVRTSAVLFRRREWCISRSAPDKADTNTSHIRLTCLITLDDNDDKPS